MVYLALTMYCNWLTGHAIDHSSIGLNRLTIQPVFNEVSLFTFSEGTHGFDVTVPKNYLKMYHENLAKLRSRKNIVLQDGPLLETRSRMCLQADSMRQYPYMSFCNFTLLFQKWPFQRYSPDYNNMEEGTANTQKESFLHLLWEINRNVKQNQIRILKSLAKPK